MREDAGWYLDTYDIFGVEGLDTGGNFSDDSVWDEDTIEEMDEADGENLSSSGRKNRDQGVSKSFDEPDDSEEDDLL